MLHLRECFEIQDGERHIKVNQGRDQTIHVHIDSPEYLVSTIVVHFGYGEKYPKNWSYEGLLVRLGYLKGEEDE